MSHRISVELFTICKRCCVNRAKYILYILCKSNIVVAVASIISSYSEYDIVSCLL